MRRRRRALVAAAFVLLASSAAVTVGPAAAQGECSGDPTIDTYNAAGPLGPIGFMGDSTGIGMIVAGGLVSQLAAAGWGPIRASAICGGQTTINRWSAILTINAWRAEGFDPPVLLLAFGSNDVGFCTSDKAACRARIDAAMAAIGAEHQVSWQSITHNQTTWESAWNGALADAASTYPLLDIADWRALVNADPTLVGFDQVHASGPAAYAKRSATYVEAAKRWTQSQPRPNGAPGPATPPTPAATPIGEPAGFVPLATPVRAVDTRDGKGGARLAAGAVTTIDLAALTPAGMVPAGATAVAVNLTVDRASAPGYLTAWGCGATPTASALNYPANAPRAAHVVIPVTGGKVCALSKAAADLIVDVDGVYVAGNGLRYKPVAPSRLLDTRDANGDGAMLAAGAVTTVVVPKVDGVAPEAVAVNLTGVGGTAAGYVSAYPCGGAPPAVSSLNLDGPSPRANLVQVKVGSGGAVCFVNQSPTHLVVDLAGVYGADGLLLQAVAPTRIVDTRDGAGGSLGATSAGQTIALPATTSQPANVKGSMVTITAAGGSAPGYVTLSPCGAAVPVASNLNHGRGEVVANAAGVLGAGCVTTQVRSQLIVDLTGWWVG